jgi:hypothetical protein
MPHPIHSNPKLLPPLPANAQQAAQELAQLCNPNGAIIYSKNPEGDLDFQVDARDANEEQRTSIEPLIEAIRVAVQTALSTEGWGLDEGAIQVEVVPFSARTERDEEEDLEQWHCDWENFVFVSFGAYQIECFNGVLSVSDPITKEDLQDDLVLKATEDSLAKAEGKAVSVPFAVPVILANQAVHRASFPKEDGVRVRFRAWIKRKEDS